MMLSLAAGGCGSVTAAAKAHPPASPRRPSRQPGAAQGRIASPYFGALAGYGCPERPQASFHEAGWFTDGINGFVNVPKDGWDKQECAGAFGAMPMSGNASKPDPANYAFWTFHTAPVMAGTCQAAVYVPDDASIEHVGGDPAHYQVYDSAAPSGPSAGSFAINQRSTRGQWVNVGSYRLSNGVLTIKLTSAGQDWHGNVLTHAHIAVSQVMVFCNR